MKLNCDLGEGFACEGAVMPFIDQANIACDAHAGSMELMRQTVILARKLRVSIGAHPGYPDRENFGRFDLDISDEELTSSISDQIFCLANIVEEQNCNISHVKPHGALYNNAAINEQLATLIGDVIKSIDPSLPIMCLAG